MHKVKKLVMGVAALGALALGGSAIAGAQTNHTSTSGSDASDQPVTGSAAQQAGAAAVKAAGGGTVASVERSDEGGNGAYEVKVTLKGKTIEVTEGSDFSVIKQATDDDHGSAQDKGDGDGEHADDHGGKAQDKGDGDGEHADDGPSSGAQQ